MYKVTIFVNKHCWMFPSGVFVCVILSVISIVKKKNQGPFDPFSEIKGFNMMTNHQAVKRFVW